ncbi:MAG: zinc-dependent metalloprotease [Terracidiphilus sp.]
MAAAAQQGNELLPIQWDAKTGKLSLGIPLTEKNGTESPGYILYNSLPYGLGQNDLGMDRGQLQPLDGGSGGGPRLVHFERVGPKVLLVEENLAYRTASTDPAEQLAVRQSFPTSILGSFHITSEANGFVVVDATDYFLRDIHHVAEVLAAAKQGSYHVDPDRSTIDPEHSKAFPLNTEVEAELTFVSENPGEARILADVAPDVHAVTVHERQSFLKLPPPGYVERRYSPRSGFFDASWREMNTPLGVDTIQQFIPRHRLQKKDPNCVTSCEAVQPIVYYIDRGAPEPVRSALQEGCSWWDQAFQAAGWAPGTFQVRLLPEDADPMDARYNIIQWVHRANRGWSYGDIVADPRTGEILKGNITLGSLRGRQDYLIAEALLAPYKDGKVPDAAHDLALAMVLARIRQLAAHETGHTLGLMHNYAASTMPHTPDQTMSVMDYPHPWITLDRNGVPDLSQAYSEGIGVWDKVAIDYGYREFDRDGKPVEDPAALEAILHNAESRGVRFLSDADARPLGSASPIAHLWDNGTNAADELNRILEVRRAALERFGENAIRPGVPMAQMEVTLVPLYLLYRYQAEAATKIIGGLDYRYTVRGDGQKGPQIVPVAEQRAALAAVVKTLSPDVLTLPEALLRQLPPRPPGMIGNAGPLNVETFPSHTSVTFDPVATAQSAADMTLVVLFNAARANRLVQYHVRDAAQPTLDEVIDAALHAAGSTPAGMPALIGTAVKARIVEALFRLAAAPETSFSARAQVTAKLHTIAQSEQNDAVGGEIRSRIAAFEREPEKFKASPVLSAPPGAPIGDDDSY